MHSGPSAWLVKNSADWPRRPLSIGTRLRCPCPPGATCGLTQHHCPASLFRALGGPDGNGEDTTSSSSEEEKDGGGGCLSNGLHLREAWPASCPGEEEAARVPTIYFSHTVEPKKVMSSAVALRLAPAQSSKTAACQADMLPLFAIWT